MRGPADDGCAAGPQAWARTASRRGPTLSQRRAGDDTASVAWRERKAARRCLGTVARAFAQGSARDRGGFRWPEGGAKGCWRQRFHSTETVANHTHRNCVTEDTGRQVRGRENAEGVQCAPRHASPARSAVRPRRTARGSGLAARRRMPRTRGQR
ncbi:hypothetical protein ERJ75_000901700 [Trypanosoma vivax]|nr:hypothetical protein ERJ75_000901700 [Trypanosoma vivax]